MPAYVTKAVNLDCMLICDRLGDQHKSNGAITANPFDDADESVKKQSISPYTASEIATLQSRLNKQLGPEWLSSRPGAGGAKVYYVETHKAIHLANEVFGFNGWNSAVQNIQIDYVDEHPQTGKISLGLSVTMRITLRDGTYHEDVGYGSVENMKGKASAFEKAKKQGVSDGVKRVLRNFGQLLGTCLQDKEYLNKVTKIKVAPRKFDVDDLYRHPDFAANKGPAVKKEPAAESEPKQPAQSTNGDNSRIIAEDMDFDEGMFDDDDFGGVDESAFPTEPRDAAKKYQASVAAPSAASRAMTTPSRPALKPPSRAPAAHPNGALQAGYQQTNGKPVEKPKLGPGSVPDTAVPSANRSRQRSSSPGLPSQHFNHHGQVTPATGRGTGFFSARAAGSVDENNNVIDGAAQTFNPHLEARSIPRNPNIDHTKSIALHRNLTPAAPVPAREEGAHASALNMTRAALPGQSQTPQTPTGMGRGFSTSHYRPPTRRGPDGTILAPHTSNAVAGGVDKVLHANRRPPLNDVSNMHNQHQSTATTPDGTDAKRQRIGGSGQEFLSNENQLSGEPG